MNDGLIALYSGLGTIIVGLGYVVIKRFSNSNCQSHTSFCDCDSPAVEMQKQTTERLDKLIETLKKQNLVEKDPDSPANQV